MMVMIMNVEYIWLIQCKSRFPLLWHMISISCYYIRIPVTEVSNGMAGGADLILPRPGYRPQRRLIIALVIQIPAVSALTQHSLNENTYRAKTFSQSLLFLAADILMSCK